MADFVAVVKDRQTRSGMSVERFANTIGMSAAALYNYMSGERQTISNSSLRLFAHYFRQQGDTEALNKLVAYATGLDDIRIAN